MIQIIFVHYHKMVKGYRYGERIIGEIVRQILSSGVSQMNKKGILSVIWNYIISLALVLMFFDVIDFLTGSGKDSG